MKNRSPLAIDLALAALVTLAFCTAAGYGLPQILDPDEGTFVAAAGRLLAGPTYDPGWYGHPAATLIYPLAALYGVIAIVGLLLGFFADLGAVQALYFDDPTVFYVTGRILSALYGGICAFILFRLMRLFKIGNFWIVIAGFVFFLSPVMYDYGTKIRADLILAAFMLLVIYSAVKAVQVKASLRWMLAGGFCVGLAVTSKYPGVLSAVAVIAAAVTLWRQGSLGPVAAIRQLIAAGAVSVLAAFATAPYLLIRFQAVLQNILREARPEHLSATSPGFGSALAFYTLDVMPRAVGVPLAVLSVFGLVLLVRQSGGRILVITGIIFLIFIASLNLVWVRWIIPLIPMAILAAFCAVQNAEESSLLNAKWRGPFRAVLLAMIFIPVLSNTIPLVYAKVTNNDTRVEARTWISNNIPKGARILIEAYAPNLDTQRYEVFVSQGGVFQRWQALEPTRFATPLGPLVAGWDGKTVSEFAVRLNKLEVDYIVLSGWETRFRSDSRGYEDFLLMYQMVSEKFSLAKRFPPGEYKTGPKIEVLKR